MPRISIQTDYVQPKVAGAIQRGILDALACVGEVSKLIQVVTVFPRNAEYLAVKIVMDEGNISGPEYKYGGDEVGLIIKPNNFDYQLELRNLVIREVKKILGDHVGGLNKRLEGLNACHVALSQIH